MTAAVSVKIIAKCFMFAFFHDRYLAWGATFEHLSGGERFYRVHLFVLIYDV